MTPALSARIMSSLQSEVRARKAAERLQASRARRPDVRCRSREPEGVVVKAGDAAGRSSYTVMDRVEG